jgi:hypothetical protein
VCGVLVHLFHFVSVFALIDRVTECGLGLGSLAHPPLLSSVYKCVPCSSSGMAADDSKKLVA